MEPQKIAIVADWLTNIGGAEKVIETLWRHFKKPPIFTTIYNPKKTPAFAGAEVKTSFLQKFPFAKRKHQLFLPWMPKAVESLNLDGYDIVISSSHSCAKGVITSPDTLHVCYCHTPIRYAWEMHFDERMKTKNPVKRFIIERLMHKIRIWDRFAADRVDYFLANSSFVAERIKKYYRRDAFVIHPPVDTKEFSVSAPKEYLLAVGRLIPYKRFDLIIEVANKLKMSLKIVGEGPEYKKLKKMAGPTVELLGKVTKEELKTLLSECRAFVFPQIEDFGIAPIEAMASGRPVIAYKGGGALDFITEKTGIFFEEQSLKSLENAILKLKTANFNPHEIKAHAENFSTENFLKKFDNYLHSLLEKKK